MESIPLSCRRRSRVLSQLGILNYWSPTCLIQITLPQRFFKEHRSAETETDNWRASTRRRYLSCVNHKISWTWILETNTNLARNSERQQAPCKSNKDTTHRRMSNLIQCCCGLPAFRNSTMRWYDTTTGTMSGTTKRI